jgi:hypothetical protein
MRTLVIHPKDKTTDFLKPIYANRDWTVITGGCTKEEVNKAIGEHDHIIMMGHGTPQGLLAMGQFNGKPKVKPATTKPSTAVKQLAKGKPVTQSHIKEYYSAGKSGSLLDDGFDDYQDDWYSSRKVGSTGGYTGYNSYSNLSTGYVIDDKTVGLLRGKRLTAIWCNADQFMEWNNLEGFYTGMFISDTSEATLIGTASTEQWQVEESNYAFSAAMRGLVDTQNPHEVLKELRRTYSKLSERNAVAKYNMLRLYARNAVKAEAAVS